MCPQQKFFPEMSPLALTDIRPVDHFKRFVLLLSPQYIAPVSIDGWTALASVNIFVTNVPSAKFFSEWALKALTVMTHVAIPFLQFLWEREEIENEKFDFLTQKLKTFARDGENLSFKACVAFDEVVNPDSTEEDHLNMVKVHFVVCWESYNLFEIQDSFYDLGVSESCTVSQIIAIYKRQYGNPDVRDKIDRQLALLSSEPAIMSRKVNFCLKSKIDQLWAHSNPKSFFLIEGAKKFQNLFFWNKIFCNRIFTVFSRDFPKKKHVKSDQDIRHNDQRF